MAAGRHYHINSGGTNLTSNQIAGVTTTPINAVPGITTPFYMVLDATNINGKYEEVEVTGKTATNVNHAATTYAHTTAEEVRFPFVKTEADALSAAVNGGPLYDTNGNESIKTVTTASAVNEITVTNAATGTAPEISATGDDANIDLKLTPKGTGSVVGKGMIIQVTSAYQAANISTTSTTFVDMTSMSVIITTKANSRLVIFANAGLSHSSATTSRIGFEIDIDGTQFGTIYPSGGKTDVGGNASLGAIVYRSAAVSVGNHTVKIRWSSVDGGTANAVARSLVVMEEAA